MLTTLLQSIKAVLRFFGLTSKPSASHVIQRRLRGNEVGILIVTDPKNDALGNITYPEFTMNVALGPLWDNRTKAEMDVVLHGCPIASMTALIPETIKSFEDKYGTNGGIYRAVIKEMELNYFKTGTNKTTKKVTT